ncbi:hypothetical protein HZB01_02765 [Candidatus Woesearchaeota archaeon]|nr:hypothetical protein [Candidatus Woesearchaeota archaeon]
MNKSSYIPAVLLGFALAAGAVPASYGAEKVQPTPLGLEEKAKEVHPYAVKAQELWKLVSDKTHLPGATYAKSAKGGIPLHEGTTAVIQRDGKIYTIYALKQVADATKRSLTIYERPKGSRGFEPVSSVGDYNLDGIVDGGVVTAAR